VEIEPGQVVLFEATYMHAALSRPPYNFHDSPLCSRLGEIRTPIPANKPRPRIRSKAVFSSLSPLSCSWYEFFWYRMSGRLFDACPNPKAVAVLVSKA
jgi:hypothetical protein